MALGSRVEPQCSSPGGCWVIPDAAQPWQHQERLSRACSVSPSTTACPNGARCSRSSVHLCPPAIPSYVSYVGRCMWGLSVSRSSLLTPCTAVRHPEESRAWIFVWWSRSVHSTMLHPDVSLCFAQLGLRRHHGLGEGLVLGQRTSRRDRLQTRGPRLHVHTGTCSVCCLLCAGIFANTKQL